MFFKIFLMQLYHRLPVPLSQTLAMGWAVHQMWPTCGAGWLSQGSTTSNGSSQGLLKMAKKYVSISKCVLIKLQLSFSFSFFCNWKLLLNYNISINAILLHCHYKAHTSQMGIQSMWIHTCSSKEIAISYQCYVTINFLVRETQHYRQFRSVIPPKLNYLISLTNISYNIAILSKNSCTVVKLIKLRYQLVISTVLTH